MFDYIEWYAVELDRRLSGKLSQDRIAIIVLESCGHLREMALHLVETERISAEEAALRSIREFGSPQKVANSFLRLGDPRILGLKTLWVAIASAATLSVCFALNLIWLHGFFDNFGETWQNTTAGIIGFLSAILLFIACRRGCRSYFIPLTLSSAAVAGSLVFILSFWIIGATPYSEGISRMHASRDEANIHSVLRRLDRYEAFMKEMGPLVQKAKSAAQAPALVRDAYNTTKNQNIEVVGFPPSPHYASYLVPYRCFCTAMVDGRIFAFTAVTDWSEAHEAWNNWQESVTWLEDDRVVMNGLLDSLSLARREHKLFFFNPAVYGEAVSSALVTWILIVMIDVLAWLSRRVAERSRLRIV